MSDKIADFPKKLIKSACAACGSDENKLLFVSRDPDHFELEPFRLVACARCGLIYVDPRPNERELSRYYFREYYKKPSRLLAGLIAFFVAIFQRYRAGKILSEKKAGRILDVGCGEGSFLATFAARGWEAWGLETSPDGAEMARRKGLKIFQEPLTQCDLPEKYFDVVTLWHSIEHLTDPAGYLRAAHRIIKDDGILFLAFPNGDSFEFRTFESRWFHLDPPRHLTQFSPETMERTLQSCGFKTLRVDQFSWEYNPFGFYQSLLNSVSSEMNFLYKTLKGVKMRLGPIEWIWNALVLIVTTPIFLPISFVMSFVLSCLGAAGCVNLYAVKTNPSTHSLPPSVEGRVRVLR